MENDVNCAGLAEAISGSAKDYPVALCLTIGTGIGVVYCLIPKFSMVAVMQLVRLVTFTYQMGNFKI